MAWAKLDDGFDDDPDIDRLSGDAVSLFVCSITWSSRCLSDGFVPEGRVRKFPGGTPEAVEMLCSGDKPWWTKVEGGYRIRGFHKYNPSAAEVRESREQVSQARSEAGRKGAAARWGNGKTDGKTIAPYPVPGPVPVSRTRSPKKRNATAEASPPPLWLEFLEHYPKRSGAANRAEAERKFAKLFLGPQGAAIVEGAKRYRTWADAGGHTGTEYVAQMTTWLRQQRWQEPYEIPTPNPVTPPSPQEPVAGKDYVLKCVGNDAVAKLLKPGTTEPFNPTHWFASRNLAPTRRWQGQGFR